MVKSLIKFIGILQIIFVFLWLAGCSDRYTALPKAKINGAFVVNSSPTFVGYFYHGSDKSHHYFVSKWKFEGNKFFKIANDNLEVSRPMPIGGKEIRLYLFPQKDKTHMVFSKLETGLELLIEQ